MNALARKIKGKVEALDGMNEQALQRKGCGPGSASERTRTSVTAGAVPAAAAPRPLLPLRLRRRLLQW